MDCVNQTERRALHRPWARAREACACVCEWVLCLSVHCRVGGGIVSQGMCARQLRVCVCVTLMDAPMERRTDAWADLTACSGGAAHIVAARLGRKHPRSAESHQSPNPSTEPGVRRRNGQTHRFTRGATWGERLRRSDSRGGSDEESCFSGHWRAWETRRSSTTSGAKEDRRIEEDGLWQLTLIAPPVLQEPFVFTPGSALDCLKKTKHRRIFFFIFYQLHQLNPKTFIPHCKVKNCEKREQLHPH